MPRLVTALLLAVALTACGSNGDGGATAATPPAVTTQPPHIHGLGVNPADGALFVATHAGLFRAPEGSEELSRVGESRRDTMGFAVTGPDTFLASGHPDPQTPGPVLLGLIASQDSGLTWEHRALEGTGDLHVIRPGQTRFYAYDAAENRLFEGTPEGSGVLERQMPPGTTIDLAVDAVSEDTVYATTDRGFFVSHDRAARWRSIDSRRYGLMTTLGDTLIMVDGRGQVSSLAGLGRRWKPAGTLPGLPLALTTHEDELLAAVEDGTIYRSTDGGQSWSPRIPADALSDAV